ncbi:hypothetical protein LTR37_003195 [Vermiconidia calcicola]|uniref:Uncharacterized protein n=1 Tax=Vermiconidia calcicola TaxID=1690605 RepID=A0ACC3NQW0_9PEZI|nr:hypothetical protein LTR37_003195 [Vermiconidia calcicola]
MEHQQDLQASSGERLTLSTSQGNQNDGKKRRLSTGQGNQNDGKSLEWVLTAANVSEEGDASSPYRPLAKDRRDIRLLTVHPSDHAADVLQCYLTEWSLEDPALSYDALSYEWAKPEPTFPITVNGHRTRIRRSLYNALRQLRTDANPEAYVIWADALCINQNDDEERGHQVAMMADVFSNASTVRAWLGKGDPALDKGLRVMERLARCSCHGAYAAECVLLLEKGPAPSRNLHSSEFLALAASFQASYWTRAWIVQELSFGKRVVLQRGDQAFHIQCWWRLACIIQAQSEIVALAGEEGRGATAMINFTSMMQYARLLCDSSGKRLGHFPWSPHVVHEAGYQLMTHFALQRASELHDYVYAMSGFLHGLLDIKPNYKKPALEVFEDANFRIIKATGSLRMLYGAASGNPALPSWVFDFTLPAPLLPYPSEASTGSAQPNAYAENPRKGQLRVMGAPLAEVVSVFEVPKETIIKARQTVWDCTNHRDRIDMKEIGFAAAALEQSKSLLCFSNGWEGCSLIRPAIGDVIYHFETLQHPLCIRRSAYGTQAAYSIVGVCYLLRPLKHTLNNLPGLRLLPQGEAERANFVPILLV